MYDPTPAAGFLNACKEAQNIFDNIPDDLYPPGDDDAYRVQDIVVRERLKNAVAQPVGYKLACTNPRIIELLKVSGPLSGRLLPHTTFDSGHAFDAQAFTRRVIECEFVFRLAHDVTGGAGVQDANTIVEYIADFMPGLEIVDHRFADFTRVGGPALIADNALHGAMVLGSATTGWRNRHLAEHPVQLMVNGREASTGQGGNVLGSPLNAMAWLANHLHDRGLQLCRGDIVTTGAACEVYHAEAGDRICAQFGELGRVRCTF